MAVSPPNTTIYSNANSTITDAAGNVWSINSSGQVVMNGKPDASTSGVIQMAIDANGVVWQENNNDLWFAWMPGAPGNSNGWTSGPASGNSAGTMTVPIPFTPTPSGTEATTIIDNSDNLWGIIDGQVWLDGIADATTSNVIQMAIVNGNVWQENASNLWWEKTKPSDTWSPGPGTSVDPTGKKGSGPGAEIWVGGHSNNDANDPANWSLGIVPVAGMMLTMSQGTMNLNGGNLAGNTLTLGPNGINPNVSTINMTNADLTASCVLGQDVTPTFNESGQDSLNLTPPFPSAMDATVNLADHTSLLMTDTMTFGALTVNGAPTSSLNFTGTNDFGGTTVKLATPNVAGTATINLDSAQSLMSCMEVAGSVGSGITIGVAADPGRENASSVVLDTPSTFQGKLEMAWSWVELKGLIADSYSYSNDVLTLFNGGAPVGSFNVTAEPVGPAAMSLRVEQSGSNVMLSVVGDLSPIEGGGAPNILGSDHYQPGGAAPILPLLPSPFPPPATPPNFHITDVTTGQSGTSAGEHYSGPVSGTDWQLIDITPDKLNITSTVKNVFIHSGSNDDALNISATGGTNILDGSTGSNFLTGGSGRDTFYVDDRGPAKDIWTTIQNFHAGDDATIWGLTVNDFIVHGDNVLPTSPGLDFAIPGKPNVNLTIQGYSTNDLANGKLSVAFGHSADTPGLPGSNYMLIHANG